MFSPGTKRSNLSSRKERTQIGRGVPPPPVPESPITPLPDRTSSHQDNFIPNRPATGTPAPWASRLSVLARIPPSKKNERGDDLEQIQPTFIGEFPQVVRDEQARYLQKRTPGDACFSGGMDRESYLAWIICGNKLFIWNYLSPAPSTKCVILDIPASISDDEDTSQNSFHGKNWLLCVVNWDIMSSSSNIMVQQCNSAGVLLCNRKNRALIYWPDIYSEGTISPVVTIAATDREKFFKPVDDSSSSFDQQQRSRTGGTLTGSSYFNSLIMSMVPKDPRNHKICIGIATSSDGEIWRFICAHTGIQCERMYQSMIDVSSRGTDGRKGYPRSLIWHSPYHSMKESKRQFLLLTNLKIQCFSISLSSEFSVSKMWSHEIIGLDGESGIQKDLAGQKQIWPLDLQVDNKGSEITVLIATLCKDGFSSSNFIEYSLMTMQYKSGVTRSLEYVEATNEKILEKKAPIQIIIPKARVEDEDFLFAMRLKVGGKPSGSAIILSGDGTATVAHYRIKSTWLYQFDLPYDAGKVLDASVFPSSDDGDGAWAVLTEKAGVWAIPERAITIGGVEPPERSLSRKGSSKEMPTDEERRNLSLVGNIAPRRASSEAWDAAGDRQRPVFSGTARRNAQDEESEALLNQLFQYFLSSGQVDSALDKLQVTGAFERDGETNVFTRLSKSIVDTLAKHWTTTRGSEIVALAVVSAQLMDKQQRHQKFLQFLALSKYHEELCSRQRQSLQIIMEHGEKLAGMIQLRELQNMISQNRSTGVGSVYSSSEEVSGSLWELIQLVGDRARRNTVLLMDRDNAEVFYSKVSELEDVFYCLDRQLECIIGEQMSILVQIQRACELSNACVTLFRIAMHYRTENHMWYPPPEGLTPWYCQPVVRSGLWSIGSFMLHLLKETAHLDRSAKLDFHYHLEALTEVLLEVYSGAISAKLERKEPHKNLLDEFWNRRDTLLGTLYQQAKNLIQEDYQDSIEGIKGQSEEIVRNLYLSLMSIAKRHEGYQTLWNICSDLNDLELLRNLMRESMGPKGGFSYFVFNQLYDNKQFPKLLRLGEEFPEELNAFLKQHKDLLWLHEIFLHQFSSASETLHAVALSLSNSSISVTKLADRKRFLNLSKIASVAGKDAGYETKLMRIEADLKILKLQEEILELLPDTEDKQTTGQQLLPPVDLIELCLKSQKRELSLHTFEVFAWTSSSFLRCNTSLLEDCWRNAANQDDWETLHHRYIAEGWSDEEILQVLRDTILFQASNRCYGHNAETFEGEFDEVLSLRQENADAVILKDTTSVEAILMQHNDYSVAGKLMLTAIMLGSVDGDTRIQEGPLPMD